MTKAMVTVATAALLALYGLVAAEAQAQDSTAPGSTPKASPPSLPRPQVLPPPRPQGPSTDADTQTDLDAAPAPQGSCPDTGRRLELVV